jgi:hypothetical protein
MLGRGGSPMFHPCAEDGCKRGVSDTGGGYCSQHRKCNAPLCSRDRASDWASFCIAHAYCQEEGCRVVASTKKRYCEEHCCQVLDCAEHRYWCTQHTCSDPDCYQQRQPVTNTKNEAGWALFCPSHLVCQKDNCADPRAGWSTHCVNHTCGIAGCWNGRLLSGLFCENHDKCENYDKCAKARPNKCSEVRLNYSIFCVAHTCRYKGCTREACVAEGYCLKERESRQYYVRLTLLTIENSADLWDVRCLHEIGMSPHSSGSGRYAMQE